jgi:alpha 1,2-mannosyltransferase
MFAWTVAHKTSSQNEKSDDHFLWVMSPMRLFANTHSLPSRYLPTRRFRIRYVLILCTIIFFLCLYANPSARVDFSHKLSESSIINGEGRYTQHRPPVSSGLRTAESKSWEETLSEWAKGTKEKLREDGLPSFPKELKDFWYMFSQALLDAKPATPEPRRHTQPPKALGFDRLKASDRRVDIMVLEQRYINNAKKAHAIFLKGIDTLSKKLHYEPGTKGIVTTAGGKYFPIFFVSLKILRDSGSTLPVEVFLESPGEYEPHICDTLLPSMNAKCVIIADIVDTIPGHPSLARYQLKAFAMLFSSFESLIFLDADSFAVRSPDPLFESEPFISKGLILWPDFWVNTASRLFYEIAGRDAPSLSERPSSESGQLLFNKSMHASTLLLACYYNYYGNDLYYPLLSQGGPGEGDKETYLSAALVLNNTVYQVSEPVGVLRYHSGGEHHGVAMTQAWPPDDFNLTTNGFYRVKDKSVAPEPRVGFVHHNYPKLNAAEIMHDGTTTRHSTGVAHRMWGPKQDTLNRFEGVDMEKKMWEAMRYTACDLEHHFMAWYGRSGVCDGVQRYWEDVFVKGLGVDDDGTSDPDGWDGYWKKIWAGS